ncbi:probable pancreatic secretory proteinase inhibitor [Xyrichtys novacula]|uniref:Probable pancreatic secretory proteinase inhibitor n=1 Tax=Xyrichtys novacula TaxID=13765 RepID=A0AAV1EV71_XYRNO|nr:probable pancreatic secretory proteinase inhibitor [Xyrichtys novacula]
MKGGIVALGLLLICLATDASGKPLPRRPSCPNTQEALMCTMNYNPVCGSNGNTYGNECSLCSFMQRTGEDILITKETSCEPR